MKILQVVPYFYPAWAYGGPAKLVYDTCTYYAKQNNQVTVFTSDAYDEKKRMPDELRITKEKNLTVFYFRNIFNTITYTYNIFCTPRLFFQALLVVPTSDVIHLHDFYTPHNLWIAFLAHLFSKPVVLSVHGCLESARIAQRSLFKKLFLAFGGNWLIQNASCLIATSDNEVKAYLDYKASPKRITRIAHGIDPAEFESKLSKSKARDSWDLPQDHIVITFLGRIHKIKGLDLLVQATKILGPKKTTIVIAGSDDGYLSQLETLIKDLKVTNITIVGACFGTRKADLFKASDIFVYPSYSEGFSLGILEAGSTGLPLVITTECHFDEVASSKSGLVVKPRATEIAKALIKMRDDAEFRKNTGMNAKKLIHAQYSMESIGESLLATYRSLVGDRKV